MLRFCFLFCSFFLPCLLRAQSTIFGRALLLSFPLDYSAPVFSPWNHVSLNQDAQVANSEQGFVLFIEAMKMNHTLIRQGRVGNLTTSLGDQGTIGAALEVYHPRFSPYLRGLEFLFEIEVIEGIETLTIVIEEPFWCRFFGAFEAEFQGVFRSFGREEEFVTRRQNAQDAFQWYWMHTQTGEGCLVPTLPYGALRTICRLAFGVREGPAPGKGYFKK